MGFLTDMFKSVSDTAKSAADPQSPKTNIQGKLDSIVSLKRSLDFQWRKLHQEWMKASSFEENVKRTPLARAYQLRKAKSLSQRMALVSRFGTVIGTFENVLTQALELKTHSENMQQAIGNPAEFKALREQVNKLMSQNVQTVEKLSEVSDKISAFQEEFSSDATAFEHESGQKELDALYEEYDTFLASGNLEKAQDVQKKIEEMQALALPQL